MIYNTSIQYQYSSRRNSLKIGCKKKRTFIIGQLNTIKESDDLNFLCSIIFISHFIYEKKVNVTQYLFLQGINGEELFIFLSLSFFLTPP
jgi:hypothetical protein